MVCDCHADVSFGMPIFDPVSILTMTAVLIIVFISESMGMFLALGEMVVNSLHTILFAGCVSMA